MMNRMQNGNGEEIRKVFFKLIETKNVFFE